MEEFVDVHINPSSPEQKSEGIKVFVDLLIVFVSPTSSVAQLHLREKLVCVQKTLLTFSFRATTRLEVSSQDSVFYWIPTQ